MAYYDVKQTRVWQYFSWVIAAPCFVCIVMTYYDVKQTGVWQYFLWVIATLCSGCILMAYYECKTNKDLAVFLMNYCCSLLWLHSDGLFNAKQPRIWQYISSAIATLYSGCKVMAYYDAKQTMVWQYFSWVINASCCGCMVMAYYDEKTNKDLAVLLMSYWCSLLRLHSDGLQRCKTNNDLGSISHEL